MSDEIKKEETKKPEETTAVPLSESDLEAVAGGKITPQPYTITIRQDIASPKLY